MGKGVRRPEGKKTQSFSAKGNVLFNRAAVRICCFQFSRLAAQYNPSHGDESRAQGEVDRMYVIQTGTAMECSGTDLLPSPALAVPQALPSQYTYDLFSTRSLFVTGWLLETSNSLIGLKENFE